MPVLSSLTPDARLGKSGATIFKNSMLSSRENPLNRFSASEAGCRDGCPFFFSPRGEVISSPSLIRPNKSSFPIDTPLISPDNPKDNSWALPGDVPWSIFDSCSCVMLRSSGIDSRRSSLDPNVPRSSGSLAMNESSGSPRSSASSSPLSPFAFPLGPATPSRPWPMPSARPIAAFLLIVSISSLSLEYRLENDAFKLAARRGLLRTFAFTCGPGPLLAVIALLVFAHR
mmetsp:Transcript_6713/g.18634  ORF Transcript_6713/g.18634 Transcript_6713/m.18634 type:complete len:229 (+) Transcript_6713:622-1308(+)